MKKWFIFLMMGVFLLGSPIDRTAKAALDENLSNGVTSDAPKIKASNDTIYNYVDGLNNEIESTNAHLTQAIQESSVSEVSDARASIPSSTTFATLKERLDEEITGVNSSIANLQVAKADKTYTDTELAKKRSSSVLIQSADLSPDVLSAIAGTAPVIATVAPFTVDHTKTTFFTYSTNLVDKNNLISGYILYATGGVGASATYKYTDYLPVVGGQIYSTNANVPHYAWYDVDYNYISGSGGVTSQQITAPANAKYLRISFPDYVWSTPTLNLGSTLLPYEDYDYRINENILKYLNLGILNERLDFSKLNFLRTGKNLFNKDDPEVKEGYYVNSSTGKTLANATYTASGYIPVEGDQDYVPSLKHQMAWYDADKNFISGVHNGTSPNYRSPANAAYARYSFYTADYATTGQVESGTVSTAYESYRVGFKWPLLGNGDIDVFLPREITVAVGHTIELYNKQVAWTGNINNYHFKWDCQVGKAMKRKFSVTGDASKVGEYPLTLTVYDNNMSTIATATTTVKIVPLITSTKTILTIGDSLTNQKPWLNAVRTWSNNKITFVGTRGTAPLQHEGRSGFTAGNYLTATAYPYESEGVHPFWDGTRFNWNHYKTSTGVSPDAVQVFLGTNGITLDPTTNASNIKQIVDYIRSDDANIPIYLVFTLYRGNQDGLGVQTSSDGYAANQGAWKLEEDRKIYNLMTELYDLLKDYTALYFVPVSLAHDSEYNFGAVETPVNPRASQTELLPVEATHPQQQGYYQIADIMLSVFSAH